VVVVLERRNRPRRLLCVSQSCQQPVDVVATRRRAVSVNVIAEMLFCGVRRTHSTMTDKAVNGEQPLTRSSVDP